MQTEKYVNEKSKKRIFFCWNNTQHKTTYSEYMWEAELNRNEPTKCPVCGQAHKITMRMGNE